MKTLITFFTCKRSSIKMCCVYMLVQIADFWSSKESKFAKVTVNLFFLIIVVCKTFLNRTFWIRRGCKIRSSHQYVPMSLCSPVLRFDVIRYSLFSKMMAFEHVGAPWKSFCHAGSMSETMLKISGKPRLKSLWWVKEVLWII